jgi:hypothetical protein
MQILLQVDNNIQYLAESKGQKANCPQKCVCGCTKFHKWGKYKRYLIDEDGEQEIYIQRIRCVKCKKTHSYLPSVCVSGACYSAGFIMRLLSALILKLRIKLGERKRRAYAYLRRFVSRESQWIIFLRAKGFGDISSAGMERRRKIFTELLKIYEGGKLLADFLRETGRHFMCAK